jgi:hypothetical protein
MYAIHQMSKILKIFSFLAAISGASSYDKHNEVKLIEKISANSEINGEH